MFTKFQEAIISFIMSGHMEQLECHLTDFRDI
jgi:hypothetical protein